MAEETMTDGGFSDDRQVEISEEKSGKISVLTQKVDELELGNASLVLENKGYKHQIVELKGSAKAFSDENVELKKKVDVLVSENKVLSDVAARAAELEGDVSKLQHDLVSATSDLQETVAELTDLKKNMMTMEEKEKENTVKLEAIQEERNRLLSKVEHLEEVEQNVRNALSGREREIQDLKKNLEELDAMVGNSQNLQMLKDDLEKTFENMRAEISFLENSLNEKEKIIIDYENSERAAMDVVDGDLKKDSSDEVGMNTKHWAVMAGSIFTALAIVGVRYYTQHTSRKQ